MLAASINDALLALSLSVTLFLGAPGGWEWATLTKAWAEDWEQNKQWPYLWMAEQLNKTGLWPQPKSPWPSWADGGATVVTNVSAATHWMPPTSITLQPGEAVCGWTRAFSDDLPCVIPSETVPVLCLGPAR